MAGKPKGPWGAQPVADLATRILDPVLKKRAGISVALIQSWEEIVGERIASASRPEKIVWPRRMGENDPFEPATLVVACEGMAALALQHETGEVIGRVNGFLGFSAVGRIRIVQKPVAVDTVLKRPGPAKLDGRQEAHLKSVTAQIEDDGLRAALERLGAEVIGAKRRSA
ncbi:DciA family protein [Mesorhizobium sp. YIM 152430]|uniref:DUF721 domain-containing protein n=1 Tax=Mesorhizobium sp. YIM 152430 TaxID=3031761 RepID=UPI0023DC16BB|nr:DciA family protein [Mesorhizobium sp. YIM 152430]MDF1601238.1 DciA family protein [Mesorhizobium sp. YIM 152430]